MRHRFQPDPKLIGGQFRILHLQQRVLVIGIDQDGDLGCGRSDLFQNFHPLSGKLSADIGDARHVAARTRKA